MLRSGWRGKVGFVAQTIARAGTGGLSRWPLSRSLAAAQPDWARRLWLLFRSHPRLQLARYACSGVAISAGYTATVVLLVELCGWRMPALASAVSFLIWTPVSYLVHRNFTFRFAGDQTAASIKFALAFFVRLAASAYTVHLATETFGSSYLVGVLTNWFVLPLINYAVMDLWVFRSKAVAAALRS
jgi:putative flippase GtrA